MIFSLTTTDNDDLKRVFARIKARATANSATPEAVQAVGLEIANLFTAAAGETATVNADEVVKRFNDERNQKANPLMPAS